MNHISVMLGVSKSLGWGFFLAGSVAVIAQNAVVVQNPVVPQGGEFSILGQVQGDQVLPSLSLLPTVGVIAWQDNIVDKNGSGIGGAMLNTSFGAGPSFGANKTATGNQINTKVQLLANNNILFVWQSSVAGTPDIYAR